MYLTHWRGSWKGCGRRKLSTSGNAEAKAWHEIKQRWNLFLRENREAIEAGEKFKIGDPRLAPDLFPKGFRLHRKGQSDWP